MVMITGISMAEDRPFDWHSSPLFSHTLITADYRNTQNVRRFFQGEIGNAFKFDRAFMSWMLDNAGKTLGDAVDEWRRRKGYRHD
ncbi:MAG: hypothetical protein HC779_03400 [Phyllobacteriaceae bacterium]|nr:hypothetical protein [Phyllobacteriaceae bacterium]